MPAHPYLEFGPSPDWVGRAALVLGLVALGLALGPGLRLRERIAELPDRWFVGALALIATLLSAGYIQHFLRGGPRIIDATSYFLEARALSEGFFSFPVPSPSGSFRGRFLLSGPAGLAVIFPPGYPLALAFGFLVGAPLVVGPVLGGLIVVATYFAGRELFGRNDVGRLAAVLSTLCAALRYQTADTMSHALSALLFITALAASARPSWARTALSGVACGWLLATRPVTGVVVLGIAGGLLATRTQRRHRLAMLLMFCFGTMPGIALLLLHQRAATGSWFTSTQLAYYALADGPPGCFGWGFGENRGCVFEHGDIVKTELVDGFGPRAALRFTLHRLALHLIDVANFAPLALLVPFALARFHATPGVRWAALAWAGIVLAYAGFYYPGSYPGAGARFYADMLPLEHGLVALALLELRGARFAPALALLGFALHAVHSHTAFADREGGRPMFEPDRLKAAGIQHGLVFVTSDHAFALGHDPAVRDPRRGVVVARLSRDAHDGLLWRSLGQPPAYRYDYTPETGAVSITPYSPPLSPFRLETEGEWPPLAVSSGWVHPDFRPCLSNGRGLHLRPEPTAGIELELVPPEAGNYVVTLGWLAAPGTILEARLGGQTVQIEYGTSSACQRSVLGTFQLAGSSGITFRSQAASLLDYVELSEPPRKSVDSSGLRPEH
jgi:hypothetical protein